MKVLILGAGGQVGSETGGIRWPQGWTVVGLERARADIADRASLAAAAGEAAPDLLVNLAAYTAVDRAEGEPAQAFRINAEGAGNVAALCARRRIPLVHLSTDYVFAGDKPDPYVEGDTVGPLNVYGASKEAGERAIRERLAEHVILRTAWVYGRSGANFVKTMLRLGAERDEIRVVADQHGSPTWAADIARVIAAVAAAIGAGRMPWGTYHYTGAGVTSWAGFAEAIFAAAAPRTGRRPTIVPIATDAYPTPARRPANSRLDCAKIERRLGIVPRPWQEALRLMLADLELAP
jgi:dTDP-4-dehydrorhamnose reductase